MAIVRDLAWPGWLPPDDATSRVDDDTAIAPGGEVVVSSSPSYATDTSLYGAVGDGMDAWYYVTWSAAATTFTAYTFSGNVTIDADSTLLTLDITRNSGIAFMHGRDDGRRIAIKGAGLGGGTHVTTIARVITSSQVQLADPAITALSASAQEVIWPTFDASQVGSIIWMDAADNRPYFNPSQLIDDTDTAMTKAFMTSVIAAPTPFSLTVGKALTNTATAAVKHIIVGTDNSQAIADAGTAAIAADKAALWFPGKGLYCAFRRMSGSASDPSSGLTAISTALNDANPQQASEKDVLWISGGATGFFTDIAGRQTYHRIIPLTAPDPFPATRGVDGSNTLAAMTLVDDPKIIKMGDSIGVIDPSNQDQSHTESALFDSYLLAAQYNKSIVIEHRSMGGATWGELACAVNARGASVDSIYPWFSNTAIPWIDYALAATQVPDAVDLPQHGINDKTGFHPLIMFSVLERLRSLRTRQHVAPDIILHTSPYTPTGAWAPTYGHFTEAMEFMAMLYRGLHARRGYGVLDFEQRALPAQWGWDATRRHMRRIPSFDHVLSSTAPLSIPARCRAWRSRLRLIGADGATVWAALDKLRIQLSKRRDNFLELSYDGAGLLTTRTQLWGMEVPTTTSITSGDATLVTSGQTAHNVALAWNLGRSDVKIGPTGSGPLTSGDNGMCLLMPGCDYNAQPQRTRIEKIINNSVCRVDDEGPINVDNYSATATAYIGGIMFVEHDAHAKTDIIITDSLGNVHQTRIIAFTDRNTVELETAWPHATLTNNAATIWIGCITDEVVTTDIDAEGDADADPYIDVSVANNHVLVRYAVGSIINDVTGWPIEPPVAFNQQVIRGGGPYVPLITCTGTGLTVEVSNAWVDEDVLFRTFSTQRLLRGTPDANSPNGGESSHAASVFAEQVWRPVLEVNDFSLRTPSNTLPGIRSSFTSYYISPIISLASTAGAVTANFMYMQPIRLGRVSVDRIGINVTAGAAGACRLGIYANDGEGTNASQPGRLILDCGTVNTTSIAFVEASFGPLMLPDEYVWVVAVFNAAPTCTIGAASANSNIIGTSSATLAFRGLLSAFTYAALPAIAPAATGFTATSPVMYLRKS